MMNKSRLAAALVIALAIVGLGLTGTASAHGNPAASRAASCYVTVPTQLGTFDGVVDRSERTSCPFARNVVRASLRRIVATGGVGTGAFTTSAYSPVTYKWYTVRCYAVGDLYDALRVDCRAGIGARVIYRAWSH
jgi:hypothetical protein